MVLVSGALSAGTVADQRAADAEAMVLGRFVGRFLHVPATRMARTITPIHVGDGVVRVNRSTPFHYWWQAHLLDAIVDGGHRRLRNQDTAGASGSARLGRRLLGTVLLRNGAAWSNHYFDDMAWLALAAQRLDVLHDRLGLRTGSRIRGWAQRTLTRELLKGRDAGGGVFWNKDRTFLNAAASGPVSLHLVRSGQRIEARAITEWIQRNLMDDRGLIIDGLRGDGRIERRAYTYNQGPILATLLALGEQKDLERATALVEAVAQRLSSPDGGALVTHAAGDGGLFTGILVRYLCLAAVDERLDRTVRTLADTLVRSTAMALWEGRDQSGVFPTTPDRSRRTTERVDQVELSTQLQGWMAMEAVANLDA